MRRLKTTFRRSKTPTGADMRTQSSLEVPIQVRSASFDEIQLEAQRQDASGPSGSQPSTSSAALLRVPQTDSRRSRSFDSAGSEESSSFLEVPRFFSRRRSSGGKSSPSCVHCYYHDIWKRQQAEEELQAMNDVEYRLFDTDSESSDDDDDDDEGTNSSISPSPNITVTLSPYDYPSTSRDENILLLSPTSPTLSVFPTSPTIELPPDEPQPSTSRRRSISRQEAFFVEPTGNSLENMADCEREEAEKEIPGVPGLLVRDIYLTVPDLKRDRAASVDSCFTKVSSAGKTEELQPAEDGLLAVPNSGLRSRSVDIVLPTSEQARYKALALSAPAPTSTTSAPPVNLRVVTLKGRSGPREVRCTPDWGETALAGEHLWAPGGSSSDFCYVGEQDCTKHGVRMRCSACKIVVHANCIDVLVNRVQFMCKPTFRDVGVRQYREQTKIQHHWVHKKNDKEKCNHCNKAIQPILSFSSKDIIGVNCSWCKISYHNKEACFGLKYVEEECDLGAQRNVIVPPSWIVKLPRKGSFKSSLRKSPKKKSGSRKKSSSTHEHKTFIIKPIPTSNTTPILVFINPKSGGNQGTKLLQKFQWLLNPRQTFDLTQGGPGPGLELFRKVPNIRILACGGDGTVGWVLSILDKIKFQSPPAVGVLPLGTGNDLARALGWGGGYEDEPIVKILNNIANSDTVLLDRWELKVEPNPAAVAANDTDAAEGKPNLPLNVVNNYFSFGVDAHIALEFHEAREAHPERFNSRLKNKLFYGSAGGKDLMFRRWRGLADWISLECDGVDMTPKLKEYRVHAIVFLNIPSYGGGTHPWNKSEGSSKAAMDDGLIEVVGLTTYQLVYLQVSNVFSMPLLQAGGHGTCITQCRVAKIVTGKTIPMQVDGEACKLLPSIITLTRYNQAIMLAKKKLGRINLHQVTMGPLILPINLISMVDYEQHYYDKDLLSQSANSIGNIEINPTADLEQVRTMINAIIKDNPNLSAMTSDWRFVDSITAERFFRIDRGQESLHYATDIGNECIFILDPLSTPSTSEAETLLTGPSESSVGPMSFDTTTAHSISLDISHSMDTPSAGVSLDVPDVAHNSESGSGSPARSLDRLSPTSPLSPKTNQPVIVEEQDYEGVVSVSQEVSGAEGPSRLVKDQLLKDTLANFRSSLLEKTSDAVLKAAKAGDLKALKELHNSGYSLLSIDSTGQTALHMSARYGHKDVVKYLLACAPSSILNIQDNDKGQTALHKAAFHKRHAICCLLVSGGASLLIQDNKGHTPRHLAIISNDQQLANYFESQEAFQRASEDKETAV